MLECLSVICVDNPDIAKYITQYRQERKWRVVSAAQFLADTWHWLEVVKSSISHTQVVSLCPYTAFKKWLSIDFNQIFYDLDSWLELSPGGIGLQLVNNNDVELFEHIHQD